MVYIVLRRMPAGKDPATGRTRYREPGEPVDVRHWPRPDVSVTRGEILPLSPEACASIVREALKCAPDLAAPLAPRPQPPDGKRPTGSARREAPAAHDDAPATR